MPKPPYKNLNEAREDLLPLPYYELGGSPNDGDVSKDDDGYPNKPPFIIYSGFALTERLIDIWRHGLICGHIRSLEYTIHNSETGEDERYYLRAISRERAAELSYETDLWEQKNRQQKHAIEIDMTEIFEKLFGNQGPSQN